MRTEWWSPTSDKVTVIESAEANAVKRVTTNPKAVYSRRENGKGRPRRKSSRRKAARNVKLGQCVIQFIVSSPTPFT